MKFVKNEEGLLSHKIKSICGPKRTFRKQQLPPSLRAGILIPSSWKKIDFLKDSVNFTETHQEWWRDWPCETTTTASRPAGEGLGAKSSLGADLGKDERSTSLFSGFVFGEKSCLQALRIEGISHRHRSALEPHYAFTFQGIFHRTQMPRMRTFVSSGSDARV